MTREQLYLLMLAGWVAFTLSLTAGSFCSAVAVSMFPFLLTPKGLPGPHAAED